jgi:hypothetical protein
VLTFLILMVGAVLGAMASAEAAPYPVRPDRASYPLSGCIHNV